jgi:hypothetical protein
MAVCHTCLHSYSRHEPSVHVVSSVSLKGWWALPAGTACRHANHVLWEQREVPDVSMSNAWNSILLVIPGGVSLVVIAEITSSKDRVSHMSTACDTGW